MSKGEELSILRTDTAAGFFFDRGTRQRRNASTPLSIVALRLGT